MQQSFLVLFAGWALTVPWLNPFAPVPSPAVVLWLVALAATAGLILVASPRGTLSEAATAASFMQRWAYSAAGAWLFAGLVTSVIGLLQYFGVTAALSPWVSQASLGEAFGNLRQRNQFASLTNMALVALVWLGFGMNGRFAGRHRWAACASACLLAAVSAALSSRNGMIQLVLLCALYGVWGSWRQPAVRRILVAAVLVGKLGSDPPLQPLRRLRSTNGLLTLALSSYRIM